MPYYKLNGQPALDGVFDVGAGGASLQQGFSSAPIDSLGGSSISGGSTPSEFPDFEEIVGHSPGTDVNASTVDSTASANGATTTSSTTQTVTYTGSGLVFNNTFGSGATQAFINEVDAAENYLQSQFGNSCTVNCSFDVENLHNTNISGENTFNAITVTYSQFVNALETHASTPEAKAAAASLASLPDPSHGAAWEIPVGEAQILGLTSPDGVTDDSVVLNSQYWSSSALANNPGDAEGVIEHELSEGIMGRIGSLGVADPGYWAPMDLFRFTASGQRDFTGGKDGQLTYFSADGTNINTGLQYHNSVNSSGQFDGEDLADWDQVGQDANAHDPFGPGGPGAGDPGTLSATDIQIMEALGWSAPGPNLGNVVAVGDFNKDGYSDLAYYNNASSTTTLQFLNGPAPIGGGTITNSPFENDPAWTIVGAGDFNHDGYSDLAYYDANTGQTQLQFLNGTTNAGGGVIGNSPFEGDRAWTVVGVGDFTNNGYDDLVYYDATTGVAQIQLLNGTTNVGGGVIANSPFEGDASWTIAGVGDFTDNGHDDLVYYDKATGVTQIQFLNGTKNVGGGVIANSPFEGDKAWTVVGVGDFTNNGYDDLVYYDATTGVTELQFLNGTKNVGGGMIANSPFENNPSWTVAGVGDFNGDGMDDLLYYNASTGTYEIQLLNGVVAASTTVLSTNTAPTAAESNNVVQDQNFDWIGDAMRAPSQPFDQLVSGAPIFGLSSNSPSMDTSADGAPASTGANSLSPQLLGGLLQHHG
jgi:hypothetical protein